MKKRLMPMAAVLCLIAALSGCGGASAATADFAPAEAAAEEVMYMDEAEEYDDAVYTQEAVAEAPMAAPAAGAVSAASSQPRDDTKLIYTGNLTVEATDFEAALQELSQLVSSYGGYFESSEAQSNSFENYACYTIRIKSEHFQKFMNAVSDNPNCKVTYQNTSVEDVGQQYYDLESHLEMLHGKLDRLNALWEQSEDMEDIISLESAISELEYEISSYSSQKNRYDSLINYSTIYMTITEVQVYSEPVDPTYGEKLSTRFQGGIDRFTTGCGNLLLFFIGNLLQICVFLICVGGVLFVILFSVRRKEKKRRQADNEEDSK